MKKKDGDAAKIKKPFYKKWWFWVIIIVVLSAIIGNSGGKDGGKSDTSPKQAAEQEESQTPAETKTEESQTPAEMKTEEQQTPAETKTEDVPTDKFVEDVKAAIQDAIGEGEAIASVVLENNDLCVYVDFSKADPAPLTMEDLALSRASSITDAILELQDYDSLWETITVDFGETGHITNSKADIQTNGFGRYFPSENFKLQ